MSGKGQISEIKYRVKCTDALLKKMFHSKFTQVKDCDMRMFYSWNLRRFLHHIRYIFRACMTSSK